MDDPASQPFFDRLFAAPLADFIVTRRSLAKELRDRGLTAAAVTLAACGKPTASAWALNQVARRHAEAMKRFLAALEHARSVIRDARRSREVQAALGAAAAEIVTLAKDALQEGGIGATATHTGRIERSLRAAPLASAEDRERLARGQLTHDIDLSGDLGVFGESDGPLPEPGPVPAKDAPAPPAKAAGKDRDSKEEAARAKAKADQEKAERLERKRLELERAAQAAETHAGRLEAIAARAQADVETLRRAAEAAIRAAADAKAGAETASQQASDARAAANTARARVRAAGS